MEHQASKKLLDALTHIKIHIGPFYPSATNKKAIVPVYFNSRHIFSNPKIFPPVIEELTRLIRKINKGRNKFDFLVGIPMVGIPLVAGVSFLSRIPFLYLEKKVKKSLHQGIVQGEFKKGDSVCLVDDTMGSGGTKFDSIKKAQKAGLKVKHLIMVWNSLSYTNKPTIKKLNKMGIKVHYLTIREEVMKYFLKIGKVSKQTYHWHHLWLIEPTTWYKEKKVWQEFLEYKKRNQI